jgi:beta-glucosidase
MREGATAFPQAIGLSATFNPALMKEVSTAIAKESKLRGIRQILTPVVNLATMYDGEERRKHMVKIRF